MSLYSILGDDLDGDDLDGLDGDEDMLGDNLALLEGMDGDDILGDDLLGDDDLMGLSMKQKLALAAGGTAAAGAGYLLYKKLRAKKAKKQAAISNAMLRKRMSRAPILSVAKPSKGRCQPLNFFQPLVVGSAGGSPATQVTQRPQTLFRGHRVVLPSVTYPGAAGAAIPNPFAIIDLKVGRNSQFVASQQMAASIFFQTAFGAGVQIDTGQISQDITFTVINQDAAPQNFEATILGDAVE